MSHKLVLVYLLTLNSSRPSSLVNNCSLACSYNLQSNKKCLTDSRGWPHLQAGVLDNPIGCKWQFRYDLFNLKWACHCEFNLQPQLKCLNFGGLKISFNLILNSMWSSPFKSFLRSSHSLIANGKKDFSKNVFYKDSVQKFFLLDIWHRVRVGDTPGSMVLFVCA